MNESIRGDFEHSLCLWISVDRCVGDGCMPALLLVPRCLSWGWGHSCVCACESLWQLLMFRCVSSEQQHTLWTCCLRLKHNGYFRQHRKQLQTSPQKGGGTWESECCPGLLNGQILHTKKNPDHLHEAKQQAPCCEFAFACSIFLQKWPSTRLVPSAVLTHSRWAELGSCSWHVPARLNVTNTFLYLGMAKAGRLRREDRRE